MVFYSAAESRISGRSAEAVVGRDFFRDVAPCTNLPAFRGRFLEGVRRGALDGCLHFTFGFAPRPIQVEVRLLQAREPDRYWIVVRPVGTVPPSRHRFAAEAAFEAVARRARAEPVDPSLCEREPIHLTGAVQPHAVMLACDPGQPDLPVRACSDNAADALGGAGPGSVVGRPLAHVLPENLVTSIREALAAGALTDPARPLRHLVRLGSREAPFLTAVHFYDGRLVVELERVPERPEDFDAATPLQAQDAVSRLRAAGSLAQAATVVAREVRAMTGFERVLVYRFDPEWNGEAIAEDRAADWGQSLLGLRFPASDIPAQARALYTKSPARFVVDRDAVPAAVRGQPTMANESVDLSFAQSRALSPVHLEYQRNLGVNGSMSLSILVEGALWGLVIGHHRRPHYVTPETRALAGLVTDGFALRIHELESQRLWAEQQHSLSARNALLARVAASEDLVVALTSGDGRGGRVTLADLFGAGGAAMVAGGRVASVGATPPPDAILGLVDWLRRSLPAGERVFATGQLSEHYASAAAWPAKASGLLAVLVDGEAEESDHALLWFRPEVASTVVWGGDPRKPVLADAATGTVLPRRSFERWVEERRGRAEPWAPWQVGTAGVFAATMEGVVLRQVRRIAELGVEREALTRALEQQKVLAREIDHRVKNSLQIVAGVMRLQGRTVADPAARTAFEDTYARVMSVARVHDSLQQSADMESVDLGETLRRLCGDLEAGVAGAAQRLEVEADPGLTVPSQTAVALSLVATELVTNALKYAYGPGEPGRVEVSARSRPNGGVAVRVCDFGRGLPSDWATRPRSGGGGLGMRVIRAMLERIGAELEVGSAKGPGTCFTVLA
ncbi:GAF domain-containing protein [Belnapia sp. T18]|uniref:histidine kinase n=1 Tax=Belnapia arida TaxID=2804533 RepID=A0ABS1UEG5_9PROT|nr:histidine kinase dimerization/phosphoacceptor domain -containing protein [Belnapia arida]MBL6082555.1 GAF domain-containing protein [Belnapia arida]